MFGKREEQFHKNRNHAYSDDKTEKPQFSIATIVVKSNITAELHPDEIWGHKSLTEIL